MPDNRVLAVCPKCHAIFQTGIAIAEGGSATVEGCGQTCPFCGEDAVIPDGFYEFVAGALKVFALATHSDRVRLAELLRTAQREGTNVEVIAETITNELPQFASIASFFLSDKGRNLATWLLLVVALLGLINQLPNSPWLSHDKTPAQVIDKLVQHNAKFPLPQAYRVGRNDPCPCGSGKKYKKCCGQPGAD